jgi:hypothetical protein
MTLVVKLYGPLEVIMQSVEQTVRIHKRGSVSAQFGIQLPAWWVIQHGLKTKDRLNITFNPDGSILLSKRQEEPKE